MKAESIQEFYWQGIRARSLTNREILDQNRDELSRYRRLGRLVYTRLVGESVLASAQMRLGANNILGNGGEQVVFESDAGEVIKALVHTIGLDKKAQQSQLDMLINNEKNAKSFLANQWLDTKYQVEKLGFAQSVITARQQKLTDAMSFNTMDDLAEFSGEHPGIKLEVGRFVAGVRRLHHHTGMYPDILGPDNVFLVAGDKSAGLVIVDTILADAERQAEPSLEDPAFTRQQMIAQKLELLFKASRS